jgi:hypothetical protein
MSMTAKFVGVLAVTTLFGVPALAEPTSPELSPGQSTQRVRTCLPHDSVDVKLRQDYGEKLIGQGISSDGTLVEIFMAPAGSFTVIKTSPEGTSCVVDFGDGWRSLNQLESIGFTPRDLDHDL